MARGKRKAAQVVAAGGAKKRNTHSAPVGASSPKASLTNAYNFRSKKRCTAVSGKGSKLQTDYEVITTTTTTKLQSREESVCSAQKDSGIEQPQIVPILSLTSPANTSLSVHRKPSKCEDNNSVISSHTAGSPLRDPSAASPLRDVSPICPRSPLSPRNGRMRHIPRKPFGTCSSMLARARGALSGAQPERLVGREEEEGKVREFLSVSVSERKGRSLYICGPPGTGKTSLVTQIVQEKQVTCKKLFIKATGHGVAKNIFSTIAREMASEGILTTTMKKNPEEGLQQELSKKGEMILLVIDEIDQLATHDQGVLYSIFGWPTLPSSRLILIGIANSLDFIERVLPRLQCQSSLKPVKLSFYPYTQEQIHQILSHRLEQAGALASIDPLALTYVSRKVCNISGDIRGALEVFQKSILSLEKKTVIRRLNYDEPSVVSGAILNPETGEPTSHVSIADVARAMSTSNDWGAAGTAGLGGGLVEEGKTGPVLPPHQQLIICALLLLVGTKSIKVIHLGRVFDVYTRICRRKGMSCADMTDFMFMCEALQDRSIVWMKKKNGRQTEITLTKSEVALTRQLKFTALMDNILDAGLKAFQYNLPG